MILQIIKMKENNKNNIYLIASLQIINNNKAIIKHKEQK